MSKSSYSNSEAEANGIRFVTIRCLSDSPVAAFADMVEALKAFDYPRATTIRRKLYKSGWSIIPPKTWRGGAIMSALPSSWKVHSDRDHDTDAKVTPMPIELNSIRCRELGIGVKTEAPSGIGVKTASGIGVKTGDASGIGVTFEDSEEERHTDPPDLPDDISPVIARCVLRDGGDVRLCLFGLARGLKGLIPDADDQALRRCVARWVAASRIAGGAVTGVDDAWAVFKKKWPTVQTPFGSRWRSVLERSKDVAVPAGIGPKLAPVFRLFAAMDDAADFAGETLYVSFRDIGKATGLDFKTASRRVAKLAGLGYVQLVQSGDMVRKRGAKANRYRFHNPPIPGGAPWNSDARSRPAAQDHQEAAQEPAREAPSVGRPNLSSQAPRPPEADPYAVAEREAIMSEDWADTDPDTDPDPWILPVHLNLH